MPVKAKFKLTIAKLIELSIDTNKDLALKIIRSKGPFKLSVDQSGTATLKSTNGILTFKGTPVLEEVGLAVKFISVNFSHNKNKSIDYNATFKLSAGVFSGAITFSGNIDMEQLILSCTGLLRIAARALKKRNNILKDREYMELIK